MPRHSAGVVTDSDCAESLITESSRQLRSVSGRYTTCFICDASVLLFLLMYDLLPKMSDSTYQYMLAFQVCHYVWGSRFILFDLFAKQSLVDRRSASQSAQRIYSSLLRFSQKLDV